MDPSRGGLRGSPEACAQNEVPPNVLVFSGLISNGIWHMV